MNRKINNQAENINRKQTGKINTFLIIASFNKYYDVMYYYVYGTEVRSSKAER